jgi:hypothetical protein
MCDIKAFGSHVPILWKKQDQEKDEYVQGETTGSDSGQHLSS